MKSCIVCEEPIKINAKKCVNCDSYQNWRRHLNLSSSVISLLIALISVSALSIGYIKDAFQSDFSNLQLALLSTDKGCISILAVNDGNRSAAMIFGELEVYDSRYGVTYYEMTPKDGSFLVKPGEAKQVDLVFPNPGQTDTIHMAWIQEGVTQNNWIENQGFETESNIQITLIQHSAFSHVFDQQKKEKLSNVPLTKFSNGSSCALKEPEKNTVELEINPFDIFPWLWKDVSATLEIVPQDDD